MPISLVQQGLIVQQEFAKLLMLGSGGRIEVAAPLTDDERRDYEIHVRGNYGFGIAAQMKSTREVRRFGGRARYMRCQFPVRATRVVNNPYFWYFIAYLDLKLMRLADPIFLIPSTEFHKKAAPRRLGAFWWFTMAANMDANPNAALPVHGASATDTSTSLHRSGAVVTRSRSSAKRCGLKERYHRARIFHLPVRTFNVALIGQP